MTGFKKIFWKAGFYGTKCCYCHQELLAHGFEDSDKGQYYTCDTVGCLFNEM